MAARSAVLELCAKIISSSLAQLSAFQGEGGLPGEVLGLGVFLGAGEGEPDSESGEAEASRLTAALRLVGVVAAESGCSEWVGVRACITELRGRGGVASVRMGDVAPMSCD